jgi:hypothetical protein
MVGRGAAHGIAKRTRAEAVDDRDRGEPRDRRVVQVTIERVERLVDAGTAQVERRGDAADAIEPDRGRAGARPTERPIRAARRRRNA